ncbi:MAG: DUF2304 domain-containing protein [Kiritimatiellae bacterium]|nr:DUF2304 domain-containing protein [Kiritimatiellia bacterium]
MKRRWIVLALVLAGLCLGGPWLASVGQMTRIRALMAAVSVGVFVITLLTIRSYKLREKYAVLWLTTAAMITLVALFPELIERVRIWFGMQYVTSLVALIFVFLLLVAFHFSIALSALNDKVAAIAASCAIMEARLKDLESRGGGRNREEERDRNIQQPT